MRHLKKRSFLLIGLLLASFSLAAHTGKTLRMAITQDEGTLTPYTYQTGYPGYELMTLIYDTLYLMDADLEPQPWLAVVTVSLTPSRSKKT
jgi:peptide/nickel transport system substrate-binding protein